MPTQTTDRTLSGRPRYKGDGRMHRRPRIAPALIALAALVALLAATSATGRSETAPSNQKEPSITYVSPIKVNTILNANKGDWNGTEPIKYAYQWLRCNTDGLG